MPTSRFTKLYNYGGYTDYVICGIETTLDRARKVGGYVAERIECYQLVHCRPIGNSLYSIGDMCHVDGNDIIGTILRFLPVGKNTCIVCNNSLVSLGSSDFTLLLDSKAIVIATGTISRGDIEWLGEGKVSTEQFVASAPPTIVGFIEKATGRRFTLVDIANFGMRYIDDIWEKLSDKDKALIPSLEPGKDPYGDSVRSAALMARFMQEYFYICRTRKLGRVSNSYAGQAMNRFRQYDYQGQIVTHESKPAAELEAGCYQLGRGEARYHGHYKGKCYLVDYNALYPYLGCTKPFPTELLDYQESPSLGTVAEWCKDSIVLMQARIKTDEPIYRATDENRAVYPIGEFNAYLSADECTNAISKGHCLYIYRAGRYKSVFVLRDYSRYMLNVRSVLETQNNRLGCFIVKCITNGLWGKLGQLGNRWIICPDETSPIEYGGYIKLDRETREYTYYRVIDGVCSKLAYCHFSDNTFPAISATANAYSRSLIWETMTVAGIQNVLYVGIDSLLLTKTGLSALADTGRIRENVPGSMRIVQSAESCYVKCYGAYRIGSKIAYSGMARSNRHRTLNWWNQRNSECLMTGEPGHFQTLSNPHRTPVEAREKLGKDVKHSGRFTATSVLYQEPLVRHHLPPARIQPVFRFGEYGR